MLDISWSFVKPGWVYWYSPYMSVWIGFAVPYYSSKF